MKSFEFTTFHKEMKEHVMLHELGSIVGYKF